MFRLHGFCAPFVCLVSTETRRGLETAGSGALWVLGTEPRSPLRTARALSHLYILHKYAVMVLLYFWYCLITIILCIVSLSSHSYLISSFLHSLLLLLSWPAVAVIYPVDLFCLISLTTPRHPVHPIFTPTLVSLHLPANLSFSIPEQLLRLQEWAD